MIRGVTRDIAKMPSVSGRNASPEAIGPKPSSPSMNCTARKNIDSWPPTTRPIAARPPTRRRLLQERGPQQRVGDPALGDRQQREQGRADQEADDRAGRGPAVLGHADERPDERDRASRWR